jgi:hypothetical protein
MGTFPPALQISVAKLTEWREWMERMDRRGNEFLTVQELWFLLNVQLQSTQISSVNGEIDRRTILAITICSKERKSNEFIYLSFFLSFFFLSFSVSLFFFFFLRHKYITSILLK